MKITDLFSHKIHSSGDDWPQKLIDIATIFSEFEGQVFDRSLIEERFRKISPRVSKVSSIIERDLSKFRDEISAYNAYLGIYKLELVNGQWILRMTETAKRFLIVEEPNVPAFMILQLIMFQYPNGNGVSFGNGTARIQANARDKTLSYISGSVKLSPFRLICKALLADSIINGIDSLHPRVSYEEISILCNDNRINQHASPPIESVITVLEEARNGQHTNDLKFELRFHILNHTDFIQATSRWLHLRETLSPSDSEHLVNLLNQINKIDIQFNGFDTISDQSGILNLIEQGQWFNYFDGITQLSSEFVTFISGYQETASVSTASETESDDLVIDNKTLVFKYPLRERGDIVLTTPSNSNTPRIQADPEVTRIKRQRSNLQHKILMSYLDEHLRLLGATPLENEHIDMYADVPNRGSYLFEVKSLSPENLLSQTRKGLSQLYEYRYRYLQDISKEVTLCLVFPSQPKEIDWLEDYLCNDRDLAIMWFDNNSLCFPTICDNKLAKLKA